MLITEIFRDADSLIGTDITVSGWVKTARAQKKMIFLQVSDGTSADLQCVISSDAANFDALTKITTGSSVKVTGKLSQSPGKGQAFELVSSLTEIYQICDHSFPLQKVDLTAEHLRKFCHLRQRTNIQRSIMAIGSKVAFKFQQWFVEKDFTLVQLPIISQNSCEGGCQPLQVTSLLEKQTRSQIPTRNGTDTIDFSKDFFDKSIYLSVSNQLPLECMAHGLTRVLTMTPATRGEPSQTTKHLAHFVMPEIEACFTVLDDTIGFAEQSIKYCVQSVLKDCQTEIAYLDNVCGKTLVAKLDKISTVPFVRIEHRDAITLLQDIHKTVPFVDYPSYDGDLSGEHERCLVKHFDHPVIVMRYPKKVKAFYMPVCRSDEIDGQTIEYVECFDLLMDIGEVVGGSQRIWKLDELDARMIETGIDPNSMDWYRDLRKYGSVPHGGFGIGLERLVAVISGQTNVKDCTAFPCTIHHCDY